MQDVYNGLTKKGDILVPDDSYATVHSIAYACSRDYSFGSLFQTHCIHAVADGRGKGAPAGY